MLKTTMIAGALVLGLASSALAEGVNHRVAVHVNENDPAVMNMALNNVANLTEFYESQGDTVSVEVVAYGPGLGMFVADSPVADRIAMMALEMDDISFAACGNTHRAMSARAGADVELVAEANIVPSGVVRLIELQEQGFTYIRP